MRIALAMMLVAAVAGCSKPASVDEENASVEQVSKAIAGSGADNRFTPGRWESKAELTALSGEGVPAGALQQAQGALAKTGTVATCLTPEKASKPGSDFFAPEASDCTYRHFKMANGVLDALLVCGPGGQTTSELKGTFDPHQYSLNVINKMAVGGRNMTMSMKVDSRHTGECRGDEKAT